MTPHEAIETIKIAIAEIEWEYPMDYTVAFNVAICSLEAWQAVIAELERRRDVLEELEEDTFYSGKLLGIQVALETIDKAVGGIEK